MPKSICEGNSVHVSLGVLSNSTSSGTNLHGNRQQITEFKGLFPVDSHCILFLLPSCVTHILGADGHYAERKANIVAFYWISHDVHSQAATKGPNKIHNTRNYNDTPHIFNRKETLAALSALHATTPTQGGVWGVIVGVAGGGWHHLRSIMLWLFSSSRPSHCS